MTDYEYLVARIGKPAADRAVTLGYVEWASDTTAPPARPSDRIVPEGAMHPPSSSSLVSLFTGAGGLDIGLEQAGFTTLLANEIEDHACQTLLANRELASLEFDKFETWLERHLAQRCFSRISESDKLRFRSRLMPAVGRKPAPLAHAQIINRDVRTLTSDEVLALTGKAVGEIDLIAGGPPCQPFSRAGKREMVDCDKGQLFMEFVRLVAETQPRWFLFENVKGLVVQKADIARTHCQACGTRALLPFVQRAAARAQSCWPCPACEMSSSVVWSSERGASLDIIINEFKAVGYTCSFRVLNAADYGAPQLRERLFIIGSRDGETFNWPAPTHTAPDRDTPLDLFSGTVLKPWVAMSESLRANRHWRYGPLDPQRAVLWVKNVVRPHDEPVTWTLDRPAPTIGAHQAAKLAIAPKGVPEAQLRRQQWHVLGRRQGDTPPVPVEHEYLTDEELLALQTFPRSWYLFGTRMERAFQIGNAVPPVLAEAVGRSLINAMNLLNIKDEAYVATG